MLAAIHIHPAWTVLAAALLMAWILWYWMRLGRANVPATRRRVRRMSLAIMLVLTPITVGGLSVIDRQLEPQRYVIAWSMVILLIFMVMATAGLDAMNNLRLHRKQSHNAVAASARELARAIAKRRHGEHDQENESS